MRLLVLHSRYQSGDASGENRVVEDEVRLLREAGHDVRVWAPSLPSGMSNPRMAAAGIRAVWSREARSHVRALLDERPADVVHVHNLFPALSPAVLRAVRGTGALVVTLHNFRLMCLPATLLRDGRVCEDCVGRVPWRGVFHRCYRSSAAASAALATSLALHRSLDTFGQVNLYLAVSEFVRDKHVEAGLAPERIVVKPNFAWPSSRGIGPGRFFLYLGRLSPEKGVGLLLEAWRTLDVPLLIAGDGPERMRLERSAPAKVRFLGSVSPRRATELLREATCLLLPSISYEGAPRSIPEAYAAGVPVIASRLGGIPEFVDHGKSGVLVASGDPNEIRQAAIRVMQDSASGGLGEGAYRLWLERFSPARGLRQLEDAYGSVIDGSAEEGRPDP